MRHEFFFPPTPIVCTRWALSSLKFSSWLASVYGSWGLWGVSFVVFLVCVLVSCFCADFGAALLSLIN
jgi:hypothetical protein